MADPKSNGPDPGRCVVCREPNPTWAQWSNRAFVEYHYCAEHAPDGARAIVVKADF